MYKRFSIGKPYQNRITWYEEILHEIKSKNQMTIFHCVIVYGAFIYLKDKSKRIILFLTIHK